MAICMKCGKSVNLMGRECPYCHTPLTYKNLVDDSIKNTNETGEVYDEKSKSLIYKSIFIPYGLYMYFSCKDKYPLKASSALGGSFIGIIIVLLVLILILAIKVFG